jgi:hypothetical protein
LILLGLTYRPCRIRHDAVGVFVFHAASASGFCPPFVSIVRLSSQLRAAVAGKMIRLVDKRVTGGASPVSRSRSSVRSLQRHSRASSRFVKNSFELVSGIRDLRSHYRLRGVAGLIAL